jgi:hypothetical protein
MPLVFGGAPVINTVVSMLQSKLRDGAVGTLSTRFLVSLGMVIAGAAVVLIFAPRPPHAKSPANTGSDEANRPLASETSVPAEQPVT